MRIIHVTKGLGLGGAERHVVDIATALSSSGYDPTVVYLLPDKNALVPELSASGVATECIEYKGVLGRILAPLRFILLCARLRPDIVHAHLPVPGVMARAAKALLGFRLIYTEHNVYERMNFVSRMAQRATNWLDDARVSCSQGVAASLPWYSEVVNNGIVVPSLDLIEVVRGSARVENQIDAGAVVVVCIANLHPKKNHALLIRAFAQAMKSNPDQCSKWLLVLVGQDGTERVSLEKLVDELEVRAAVRFTGPKLDVKPFLALADVYCMSSDFEGLPIALLEAMSFGVPAVVTDAGGMGKVVRDGACGSVVPVGDCAGLADSLSGYLKDPERRSKCGAAARQAIEDSYTINACVERLKNIYHGRSSSE